MPTKSTKSTTHKMDAIPVVLVKKAGRKVWSARITLPSADAGAYGKDGNRVDRGTGETDLEQAKTAAYKIYADLTTKVARGERVSKITFRQVLNEYLAFMAAKRDRGEITETFYKGAETSLNRYYLPFFEDMDIGTISHRDLVQHSEWRLSYVANADKDEVITYERTGKTVTRPFNPSAPSVEYLRKERARFAKLMEYASGRGYLEYERIPKYQPIKGRGGRRAAFTEDEISRIQRVSAERIIATTHRLHKRQRILAHYRMLFIYLTGCRPQEVTYLTFADLERCTDKAGETSWRVNLKPHHLKNKAHTAHLRIIFPQRGLGALIWNVRSLYKEFDNHDTHDSDYIFHTEDGGIVKKTNKTIKSVLAEAGLTGPEYSLYSFRHTFITERLYERQDVYFVARWVGTSLPMIEAHYAHLQQELEHQTERRAENTVILEPFSLDYFMGRKTTGDESREPTIFERAAAEVPGRAKEYERQCDEMAQFAIDNYEDGNWDKDDPIYADGEEMAARALKHFVGTDVSLIDLADRIMTKLDKTLDWV